MLKRSWEKMRVAKNVAVRSILENHYDEDTAESIPDSEEDNDSHPIQGILDEDQNDKSALTIDIDKAAEDCNGHPTLLSLFLFLSGALRRTTKLFTTFYFGMQSQISSNVSKESILGTDKELLR